jgi:hypothetical protein
MLLNVPSAKEHLVGISPGTMKEPTRLWVCQGEEEIGHFLAAGEEQGQAK